MAEKTEYDVMKDDVLAFFKDNLDAPITRKDLLAFTADGLVPLIEQRAAQTEDAMATEDVLETAEGLLADGGEIAEEWQIFAMAVGAEAGFFDKDGNITEKMPAQMKEVFKDLQEKHREWNKDVKEFQTPVDPDGK